MSYEPRKTRRVVKVPPSCGAPPGPASAYTLTARKPRRVKPGPGSAYVPTGLRALQAKRKWWDS